MRLKMHQERPNIGQFCLCHGLSAENLPWFAKVVFVSPHSIDVLLSSGRFGNEVCITDSFND
jgi:hypothetical protein